MKCALLSFVFYTLVLSAAGQNPLRKISDGSDVTVIVFLATDCPISQKYIPRLNEIHTEYKDTDVTMHAVIPGKTKKREIKKFQQEYNIGLVITVDRKYELVKALSATTTPEVFVLDDQLAVRYRGAIDNWFYGLGAYRKQATDDYLADAIKAVSRDQTPKVEKTKALGCIIQVP